MLFRHPACARLPLLWITVRLDQLADSLVSCAVDTMLHHDDELDRTTFRELNAEYMERMADVLAIGAQIVRAAGVAQRYCDTVPVELMAEALARETGARGGGSAYNRR